MVIACSAFAHFLIEKAEHAGLLLEIAAEQ
jgi:hypothetical protein